MGKKIIDSASNIMYLVKPQVEKFKAEHPDETVIIAAASKARKMNNESGIGLGLGWATSRRAALILTENAFYCRDWVIPISKLKYAEIVSIPSIFGYTALVMKLADNEGNHYQFGLNNANLWLSQNVVSFKRTEPNKYYSWYILAARIFLLLAFIFWLIQLVN